MSFIIIYFILKIIFSVSIIVISFAEYAAAPFYPGCAAPEPLKKCLAIMALLFITMVNGLSVKAAQKMQILFTIVKLGLVAALIIGGFIMIGQGETQNFQNAFDGTATSPSAWAIGIYNGINFFIVSHSKYFC